MLARKLPPKAARNWARALPSLQPKGNGNTNSSNTPTSTDASSPNLPSIDPSHYEPLGSWVRDPAKIDASRQNNPFLMTWVPGSARNDVMTVTHGDGIYLFDEEGNQYIDWTSQAVCANLGHSIPPQVIAAVQYQMTKLPFVYGGIGIPEIRTRINQLMAELLAGCSHDNNPMRAAVFPSSGAEANEAGIMIARRYTGRHKVLSFYRSYHGATAHAGAATGDRRRWYGSDSIPGFIKAFSPFPLFFHHGNSNDNQVNLPTNGATMNGNGNSNGGMTDGDDQGVESALLMLEEQILNEGPDQIASIVMESIVGAGGCLVFPLKYMQGVRAICDKYGILLHFDEVMVGFGRTGKLFGFQNYCDDNGGGAVLPDIITAAKGISGAAVPLSMTACTQEIMGYFQDKPLGWGSTYQAHPVALACGYETIKYILEKDIIGHVQQLAPLFENYMHSLAQRHPCIKQYRAIGLFGCFDVQTPEGTNPKLQHETAQNSHRRQLYEHYEDAFQRYKKAFKENGLVGLHRFPHIHCAPPLIITEEQLLDGFERLDRALAVLDEALGFYVDAHHLDHHHDEEEDEKKEAV